MVHQNRPDQRDAHASQRRHSFSLHDLSFRSTQPRRHGSLRQYLRRRRGSRTLDLRDLHWMRAMASLVRETAPTGEMVPWKSWCVSQWFLGPLPSLRFRHGLLPAGDPRDRKVDELGMHMTPNNAVVLHVLTAVSVNRVRLSLAVLQY